MMVFKIGKLDISTIQKDKVDKLFMRLISKNNFMRIYRNELTFT